MYIPRSSQRLSQLKAAQFVASSDLSTKVVTEVVTATGRASSGLRRICDNRDNLSPYVPAHTRDRARTRIMLSRLSHCMCKSINIRAPAVTTSVTTSGKGCHVVTDARKDQNRDRFPGLASVVDQLKAAFGDDQVRVIWVKGDDGVELGRRPGWYRDAD